MKYFPRITFTPSFFRWGLISLVVVVVIQTAADLFDWYYIFPRLDTPMHILGGFLVGCFALAYLPQGANSLQKLLWVICWVLLIGIGVEMVEWILSHVFRIQIGLLLQSSIFDTFTDIIHDFVGGVIAYAAGYFSRRI